MALAGMQAKVALEHRRAQQEAEGENAARDEGEGALDLLSDASMSKVGADRIARARMASEARSGEAPSRPLTAADPPPESPPPGRRVAPAAEEDLEAGKEPAAEEPAGEKRVSTLFGAVTFKS